MKMKNLKVLMILSFFVSASWLVSINTMAADLTAITNIDQETHGQKKEKWLKLKNDNGFTLSYPSNWQIYVMSAPEDDEPSLQESSNINLSGPKNDKTKTFGFFQLSVDYSRNKSNELSPKEYLKKHWENDKRFKILAERELTIAGEPAYEMTIEDTRDRPFKHIRVKNKSYIYDIIYHETTPDKRVGTPVDSWPSAPIFEKILNLLEFNKEKSKKKPLQ